MTITTFSWRMLNRNASRAKMAARSGPVFITDRGRPAHVLVTFEAYKKLICGRTKIADLLAMPGTEEFELQIVRSREMARPGDFS